MHRSSQPVQQADLLERVGKLSAEVTQRTMVCDRFIKVCVHPLQHWDEIFKISSAIASARRQGDFRFFGIELRRSADGLELLGVEDRLTQSHDYCHARLRL